MLSFDNNFRNMPQRLPAEQRRPQIADAILTLLGDHTVEEVTTRRIAEVVGISQPALFRHFPSRDDLLVAAVDRVRQILEPIADASIQQGGIEGIRHMASGLFQQVSKNPGLPRLLFFAGATSGSVVDEQCPKFNRSLRMLVSLQRNLVAELLRSSTLVTPEFKADPRLAARIFVGLIQGTIIQARFGDHHRMGAEQVAHLVVDFWVAGLDSLPESVAESDELEDQPGDGSEADGANGPNGADGSNAQDAAAIASQALLELDVRPLLDQGIDPLNRILLTLEKMPASGVLQITAPFQPTPLLSLLTAKGFGVDAREFENGEWKITVRGAQAAEVVDLCELEAPEPMERCLLATAELKAGESWLALLPRVPQLLLPRLTERGLTYHYLDHPDGTALIRICKPLD
jgi:TetR/AcrR family transcriptional regulator